VRSDFFDLLARLVEAGVDFVIVGGFAGVAHGCTYVTQDIDICCDFSPDNLLRLQNAISDLHAVHRMTPKQPKLNLTKENCTLYKNLYLDTEIGQLDCLSFIDGVGDYEKVKTASEVIQTEDIQLRILNIEALIESKKAMGRELDKQAILQLETIKELKSKKSDNQ
jgi:hypothetical protein